MRTKCFFVGLCMLLSASVWANDSIKNKIEQIIASKNARVGVAVFNAPTGNIFSVNGNSYFPMQSVYKFHLALCVLDRIDKGEGTLNDSVYITLKDLLPNTWSPLRDAYPMGNVRLPLSTLVQYMVSVSDNSACDILFRLVGGCSQVHQYIRSLGISDIAIVATEEEMHRDWETQYRNRTTPLAAIQLLTTFYKGEILSATSHNFLWKIMTETTTGAKRIKGNLPNDVLVGHKIGSSFTQGGVTAATNDIGIVVLPNGKWFAIAVFVSDSKESDAVNEQIIADIAKVVYDSML